MLHDEFVELTPAMMGRYHIGARSHATQQKYKEIMLKSIAVINSELEKTYGGGVAARMNIFYEETRKEFLQFDLVIPYGFFGREVLSQNDKTRFA